MKRRNPIAKSLRVVGREQVLRDKREELRALAAMSDDEIDTSDIPEVTDWSGAVRGKCYGGASKIID